MKAGKMHKAATQDKKKMKNRPIMPRTAGLVTVSKMAEKLTKAGIDPSRVVERAQLIAKARSAERKRKRDEDEDMDVDEHHQGGEDDWMDVDDETQPRKRQKIEGGATQAVPHGKRQPKTDRTTIGMRDGSVCFSLPLSSLIFTDRLHSKSPRQSNYATWASERGICMPKLASLTVRFGLRWYVTYHQILFVTDVVPPAEAPLLWEEKSRKNQSSLDIVLCITRIACFFFCYLVNVHAVL